MKYVASLIMIHFGLTVYSQPTMLFFSPTKFITHISYYPIKFPDGQNGIGLTLIEKVKGKPSILRPDSIILKSISNNSLTINRPYRDTIYYLPNGDLSINSVHKLNESELNYLKVEDVKDIVFIVDGKPVPFKLKNKSRRELKLMAINKF